MIRDDKLDFWLQHELNIMFVGRHGVGKTAMIKACFERAGLVMGETYLYFSASTLDPWVDLVGVPRERVDDDGNVFLDLVRPKALAGGDVEAVFFDEFNRSPKKVRNAVMELLQFKSINGKKFPNLKVVWAAINPEGEDEEYDVEKLDPAQQDRFHITVEVPYKPAMSWFVKEFGEKPAKAAISWWDELSEEEKKKVSPRRLEYALSVWMKRGDPRDVLPVSSNVTKLLQVLNTGPASEKIDGYFKDRDAVAAKLFLSNENNFTSAIRCITEREDMMDFFLPLLSKEKISLLMTTNDRACRFICSRGSVHQVFASTMKDIINANQNKKLVKRIRKALSENQNVAATFSTQATPTDPPDPPHFVKTPKSNTPWANQVGEMKRVAINTTQERMKVLTQIGENIPEKMTADEALATLELFDAVVARCWTSTIASHSFKSLVGMVNHAIAQLALNTGMGWSEIVAKHGGQIRHLLEKLRDAGIQKRLYTPASK